MTRARPRGADGNFPVHPVAALFPMMSEDELADLAADIKANGLNFPIVFDTTGEVLVDGRNRLKACEIAGVEPQFRCLDGEELVEFILAMNVSRRHLTPGQIAMVLALTRRAENLPEPGSLGGRGKRGGHSELARKAGISNQRVSEATLVIEWAPEMVDDVMSHTTTLDRAYNAAVERKKAKEWRTEGMEKLRKAAPDFASRVDKGELSFEEARTLLFDRNKAEEQIRQTSYQMLADFARLSDAIAKTPRLLELPQWLENEEYKQDFQRYFKGGIAELETAVAETSQQALAALEPIIAELKKREAK